MLDYYYDLFINEYGDDDDGANIFEFCDTNAIGLSKNECIQLINEQFEDQINAMNEYHIHYGIELIYEVFEDRNLMRIYHILAFLAMKTYILEKINDNLSDADTKTDTDTDTDAEIIDE
jgi:hypothetical protein